MEAEAEHQRDAAGRFARSYPPEVRAAVRVDYESSPMRVQDIGDKHAVPNSTIYGWVADEEWIRRRPPVIDPNDLLGRALGLLDRQMVELEIAMNNGAAEVAMLAKLVVTLDRVLMLKGRSTPDKPRSSKRAQELRAKIAERIGELNRA